MRFRLQKDFRLSGKLHLALFADALNLLNGNAAQGVVTSLVKASTYLYPLQPLTPRRVMLGAKIKF